MLHSIVLEYLIRTKNEKELLEKMADFSLLARTLTIQTEPNKEETPSGSQLNELSISFYTQQQQQQVKASFKKRYQVINNNPLIMLFLSLSFPFLFLSLVSLPNQILPTTF
jgi:hypothetical protein